MIVEIYSSHVPSCICIYIYICMYIYIYLLVRPAQNARPILLQENLTELNNRQLATYILLLQCRYIAGLEEALYNCMIKPNLTLKTIQLNIWAADNFTTPDILFLSVVL